MQPASNRLQKRFAFVYALTLPFAFPVFQNRLLPALLRDRALEATSRIVLTSDRNSSEAADRESLVLPPPKASEGLIPSQKSKKA